ncbi:hypothetical protein HDE69_000312 [Pedobacter cryoconitis]|uniref:MACPF domain-containing protein n=1 Tax=Pedobacter cryoconitis TaxID=188932 RepID=A0A7W8YPA1_9SPHI|nr:MAC/perforin domain-containing protein [Pedobacter cryoconitis]MBB5619276.1 hypothetical protein [Pedobacter cryoconitis]
MKHLNYFKTLPLASLALLLFVTGCKKNISNPESTSQKNGTEVTSAGDKVFDLLGFGYDVTGKFASISSAQSQVIDVNKAFGDNNQNVGSNLGTQTYFDYHFGEDAIDYSSELTQSYKTSLGGFLGKLKLFNAELTGSGSKNEAFSSKYSYGDISMLITQKYLRLNLTPTEIRANYLTDKFKSDVNNLSSAELVARYGTHVLSDITLGAKLVLNYRAQNNSSDRKEAVKAGAVVNGLFGVFGMTGNITKNESLATANFDQTLSYRTVGGDASKGLLGEINLDKSVTKLNVGVWQSGCTLDNAALIIIGDNGLIPLWDLIEDSAKKSAVQNYIFQYLSDRQVSLSDITSSIKSSAFFNAYLRLDATNYSPNVKGFGRVNCQYSQGPNEQLIFHKFIDGTYSIESKNWPGVYLRMDGSNVPNSPSGGGYVNLQSSVGEYEKFNIIKQSDGTYLISSVKFPGKNLRMDASGVTQTTPAGGGQVNVSGQAPQGYEKFIIVPALY